MKQKGSPRFMLASRNERVEAGLAPLLVIILIAVAIAGGYLIYTNYLKEKERILTYEEAERFIINCKVYSIGRSHKDIDRGYLTIKLRNVDSKDNLFKANEKLLSQIREKVEGVTSSGKCPKVIYWME